MGTVYLAKWIWLKNIYLHVYICVNVNICQFSLPHLYGKVYLTKKMPCEQTFYQRICNKEVAM